MKSIVTIGTRGSQLALWQAKFVKQQLTQHFPDIKVETKIIKTTGDAIQNRSLVGLGKGVFTKEIEIALLDGGIDLAVHSLKDLPTEMPKGLCVAAIPTRDDPRDVLVTSNGCLVEDLPIDAKIGTTSPRRKAQLLYSYPYMQVIDVRGNVDTRLRKLKETDLDGIILAAAGLKRLKKQEAITQYFDIEQMVPAVGQGALAIQARGNDKDILELLAPLNDTTTYNEITAERTLLEFLGGGCQLPIGAYAKHAENELTLIGTVCHPEGKHRIVERANVTSEKPEILGTLVAEKLLKSGANELLLT